MFHVIGIIVTALLALIGLLTVVSAIVVAFETTVEETKKTGKVTYFDYGTKSWKTKN